MFEMKFSIAADTTDEVSKVEEFIKYENSHSKEIK
jgi:hypothetical protein